MSSRSLQERLRLAKIVLKEAQKGGQIHYSVLMKRTILQCGTDATFKSILNFLLKNGYLIRVSRGIYEITFEGIKLLEAMPK